MYTRKFRKILKNTRLRLNHKHQLKFIVKKQVRGFEKFIKNLENSSFLKEVNLLTLGSRIFLDYKRNFIA